MQIGYETFYYVISKFNPEKGKLSSYYIKAVRHRIQRELILSGSVVALFGYFYPERIPAYRQKGCIVKAPVLFSLELIAKYAKFDPTEDMEDKIEQQREKIIISRALSFLPERIQAIIIARFGLDGHRSRSLREVGEIFNVTRERIRQIEVKVLKKFYYWLAKYFPERINQDPES